MIKNIKRLFTHDFLMVKCPTCGTNVSGAVTRRDLARGLALLQCAACGQQIRLSPPPTIRKTFLEQSLTGLKIYFRALRIMGAGKILLTGTVWAAGWYFGRKINGIPQWVAIVVPGLPFLVAFFRAVFRAARQDMEQKLGIIRDPFQGMSCRRNVKVHSIDEEYRLIHSRQCPLCRGPFKTGIHSVIYSPLLFHRLCFKLFHKVIKLFDQVEVQCRQCGRNYAFYFDIDAIDYVARLKYTREMVLVHMQAVREYLAHKG